MQSIYIRDIFQYNNININTLNNKFKEILKNKYLYIPYIGLLNNNETYKLPKKIFYESRLFYGKNKLLKICDNTYIQFEGNNKIMSDKWYIKTILGIIENYNRIFDVKTNIKIYIQVIQKKINNNSDFIGGYASYNAIELILDKKDYNNLLLIKSLIAHELLHLYFPYISSKYGTCYNEGLLDYLSVILNFSYNDIFYYTKYKMEQYYGIKQSPENIKYLYQKRPYIMGYLYGFLTENKSIEKIINYIKIYIKKRRYMLIHWNNKSYISFIKNNLFINKFCKEYTVYKL
jgi:hypothetical protein